VQQVNANWAKVLGLPEAAIEVICPGGDRKVFQQTLADIGVGLELSVNHQANHAQLMQALLSGSALPFDELR
jgi:hypothetical protein